MRSPAEAKRKLSKLMGMLSKLKDGFDGNPYKFRPTTGAQLQRDMENFGFVLLTEDQVIEQGYRLRQGVEPVAYKGKLALYELKSQCKEISLDKRLRQLLDEVDLPHLECDGFARVAHHILEKNNVDHLCFVGKVSLEEKVVSPHYWLQVGKWTIDYQLPRWLNGAKIPCGVFQCEAFPDIHYQGTPKDLIPLDDDLIDILITPIDPELLNGLNQKMS